jgi:DNA polymerase-1
MNHISFVNKDSYTTALLIKDTSFNSKEIQANYPLDWQDTICFSLTYENGKAPVKLIKEALGSVLKACKHLGVTTLFVADTNYFKTLVKVTKAEPLYGSICDCALGNFKVILAPNWQALFYNPAVQSKIDLAVNTLKNHLAGTHTAMGTGIIHFEEYPENTGVLRWLQKLYLEYPLLTCDIETTGLTLNDELLSISFAWNQHEGIAFAITEENKGWLRDFFCTYKGRLIFHRATFDVTQLIHKLFMKDWLDYEGMLHGLDQFNIEDTQVLAYLATNSTAGNDLKLKNLALEFAGNYAILDDETKVTDIPIPELLTYNLTDALATWYLYNKYLPVVIQDDQLEIYELIMLPSIKSIVHMQLVGFPMDKAQIDKTHKELSAIRKKWEKQLEQSKIVKDYAWKLQVNAFIKKNAELKVKHIPIDQFKTELNPNSGKQIAGLLYDHLGLKIINTTDSGLPATDKETLEALYTQLLKKYNLTEDDL